MTPLQRITERVCRLGNPDDITVPRPLLTLEEFFEGNDVLGSIGWAVRGSPRPADFYAALKDIAARKSVKDIRVQISAFHTHTPEWPYSDTVFIMTTARPHQVMGWFPEAVRPDDAWRGFPTQAYEPYSVPAGAKPVACWWDDVP